MQKKGRRVPFDDFEVESSAVFTEVQIPLREGGFTTHKYQSNGLSSEKGRSVNFDGFGLGGSAVFIEVFILLHGQTYHCYPNNKLV